MIIQPHYRKSNVSNSKNSLLTYHRTLCHLQFHKPYSKEATKGRTVTIGGQTIRIRRAALNITVENATILQFLDAVSQADKYSELAEQEMIDRLLAYLKKCKLTQKQLSDVSPTLTGATAKKLIE